MKAVSYSTGLFIILLLIFIAGCKKDEEEPLPPPPDNPCPDAPTIEWMEQTYKTIQIGDQCWMRENLNVGEMILGDQDMTDNGVIEKYCYDNDPANCETYGGLYQWDEMMQYISDSAVQGICPDGWHIPTVTDWNELTDHLGGKWPAGDKLRDQGDTYWSTGHEDATNESGFTALPGGQRTAGRPYRAGAAGDLRSAADPALPSHNRSRAVRARPRPGAAARAAA